MKYEDPWFRSRQARHNFASEEDEEQWIRRERKEPMDRSTFGPFRFSTTMDWLYDEGVADSWEWLYGLGEGKGEMTKKRLIEE